MIRKRQQATNIDPEIQKLEKQKIIDWESEIKLKELEKQAKKSKTQLKNNVFSDKPDNDDDDEIELNDEEKQKIAELEKNKGNEALRSNVCFIKLASLTLSFLRI